MADIKGAVSAEEIAAAAKELLIAVGYAFETADEALLAISARHTEQEIRNFCNLPAVPEALKSCAASLACAEFAQAKLSCGSLAGFAEADLSPAIKQIEEGDTNLTYDTANTASPQKRLQMWLDDLKRCKGQLTAFRRLRW